MTSYMFRNFITITFRMHKIQMFSLRFFDSALLLRKNNLYFMSYFQRKTIVRNSSNVIKNNNKYLKVFQLISTLSIYTYFVYLHLVIRFFSFLDAHYEKEIASAFVLCIYFWYKEENKSLKPYWSAVVWRKIESKICVSIFMV